MIDTQFENFEWMSRLARGQMSAAKAVKKGRGPLHRAAEPPLEQAYAMLRSEHWRAKGITLGNGKDLDGPSFGFINFVVIGCFLILCEIVISLMLARSVRKFVHIFLPAFKTDPAAFTTTKSWSCVYNYDRNLPRPYHVMVDQLVPIKERIAGAHR